MFTKRHYEAIAKSIKQSGNSYPGIVNGASAFQYHEYLIEKLADMFAGDNPIFDREKFFKACGIDY